MDTLENKLFSAVDMGNKDQVKKLLMDGASLNTLIGSGKTILGQAVRRSDIEVIRILLDCETYYQQGIENKRLSQISDESQDDLTSPPEMSFSSLWGPLGPFSSRRKCDINLTDVYERTPLHYAAEQGNVDVLNMLISSGCRTNVSDSENVSPLHIAVSRGHLLCVQSLLRSGCPVNQKTRYNSDKVAALHMAASIGNSEVTLVLLKYGAKIDILDASERTSLFLAVSSQNYEVVKILLDYGAKVNVAEIHGYTPLTEAVWKQDVKLVKMLIQAGAHVTNSRTHNLLHYSVRNEQLVITKFLIDAGSHVNIRDDNGDSSLHIACRKGSINMVEFLTDCGAHVSLPNAISGTTPLHEAVSGISEESHDVFQAILKILLSFNCPMNSETFTPGETPLYNAIILEKFLFAQTLISNGSDVNLGCVYTCNIDNLYLATKMNNFNTVRMIVHAGFNLNKISWLDSLPSPTEDQRNSNTIKKWLIQNKTNPLTLSDLCRIAIRRIIGENTCMKLKCITLPKRIQRFLLLEPICDT